MPSTSRRIFLKNTGFALFGIGATPSWLARAAQIQGESLAKQSKKVLVVIFQRGAVDGLNMIVPFGEQAYYSSRPTIAIARPDGTSNAALRLDDHFGLHPALRSLKPLWDRRELAVVHAVGSPDPTRSHFDAQDYMESGTPGLRATTDGWLNRSLQANPSAARTSPFRAVSLTADVPRSLRGHCADPLALQSINDLQLRNSNAAAAFEQLYLGHSDPLLQNVSREAADAMRILQTLQNSHLAPGNGVVYPKGRLGSSLEQIAQLIKADVGLEVAFADVGGWDTHVNEVGRETHTGQLANLLEPFGNALAAFAGDLGDRMADVTVVTMSEFGRTVRENGNRGTDHGHANVMLVLGGAVRGGQVYGAWPGLNTEQLHDGRDLQVTTDFRTVLGELVRYRNHSNRDFLNSVFPGFHPTQFLGLLT